VLVPYPQKQTTKDDKMTKKTVKDWVLNEVKDGSINLEEVVKHGCVNGCVSSLIYYEDTNKFYDKFEEEIWEMLYDEQVDFGFSSIPEYIASFNGSKDVGSLTQFKNLLAWYAVENVANQILNGEENRRTA
jgi:hypothetical protein